MEILKEIENKIITNEWIESKGKGNGGVGITLESLLNKENENFELPDYKGIELKAKCSKKEKHITLFCATPDSYIFEIKRLLQKYGYPDRTLPEYNVFNISVYGNKRIKLNDNYFKTYVDWNSKKIILRVCDNKLNIIDELTSWSFNLLQEKLERKLSKLAIVHAERKFEHNKVFFKYTNIDFYQLSSFEVFLLLIDKGIIRITFRVGVYKSGIRIGEIYDHGTCFSIDENYISKLFDKINLCDQGE